VPSSPCSVATISPRPSPGPSTSSPINRRSASAASGRSSGCLRASVKRLADLAVEPGYKDGATFGRFIQEDEARWKATIERAKIPAP